MQLDQLKRREFITPLGGTTVWPLAARAQQPEKLPLVGVLSASPPHSFRRRLARRFWKEGYDG
jgi:hypothetical protein